MIDLNAGPMDWIYMITSLLHNQIELFRANVMKAC